LNETELKEQLSSAALAYGRTGEGVHLERIRELTRLFDGRRSLRYPLSAHAIMRFMQRSGCKSLTKAEKAIKRMLDRAEEMRLKDRWKAIQLINHDFKDALYFKWDGWILVICNDTVVTCHLAKAKRWKKLDELRAAG
jgi:hypothetical protein